MKTNSLYVKETESTNILLKRMLCEGKYVDKFILYTDYQTSGKGQTGNSWESEAGKNLLFSILLYPNHLLIENQFILSQMISIAIVQILKKQDKNFSIKWPNDIYWQNKKIGGILIENSLQGNKIKNSIIGVGLNINQKVFKSNAPNPISLIQIKGKSKKRKKILENIYNNFVNIYSQNDLETIKEEYFKLLYRKDGFHTYLENGNQFNAKILNIELDGKLVLETDLGEKKFFYFKEVEFLI